MHMDSKDLELFVQKMMDKIVQFYYGKVKEDFGGEGMIQTKNHSAWHLQE